MNQRPSDLNIKVSIPRQELTLLSGDLRIYDFPISTAKNGPGEVLNSEQTPRGLHKIRAKIGRNARSNTVFVGRRPTGEIYNQDLDKQYPERDWILTRILWLSGLEKGKNRMGERDTMRRYIYIHGCPDNHKMGRPSSRGCIKMHNHDLIYLFDLVPVGTEVLIED